jgi:hypothetical protein
MSRAAQIDVSAPVAEISVGVSALTDRKTARVRTFRRAYSKRLAKAERQIVVSLALHLLKQPDFLFRFIAYELITHHRAALRSLGPRDLERLGHGIASWYAVDAFALFLSGPAWREKQVADGVIHQWAKSTDRWWRRAALVSTVPLNNKA